MGAYIKITCPTCKIERDFNKKNLSKLRNGVISKRCFKCSRLKKGQVNSGSFKKGLAPWNKGRVGVMPEPWNKGKEGLKEENNGMWKGESASYAAKHIWVNTHWGKPKKCDHCNTEENRMYHWANISDEYKREREDWLRLCVPCHSKFDKQKSKLST